MVQGSWNSVACKDPPPPDLSGFINPLNAFSNDKCGFRKSLYLVSNSGYSDIILNSSSIGRRWELYRWSQNAYWFWVHVQNSCWSHKFSSAQPHTAQQVPELCEYRNSQFLCLFRINHLRTTARMNLLSTSQPPTNTVCFIIHKKSCRGILLV